MSYPISELIQKRVTREVGEEKPLSPARNSYKSPVTSPSGWSPNLGRGKTKHHSARLRTEEDGAGRATKHKSG